MSPGREQSSYARSAAARQKINIDRQWKLASDDCRTTAFTGLQSG